jgi:hypothetical protein
MEVHPRVVEPEPLSLDVERSRLAETFPVASSAGADDRDR